MNESATDLLADLLPIDRVARAVAPIADDIEHRYFNGGIFHILRMLGESEIGVDAISEPPPPPFDVPSPTLTRQWFAAIQNHRSGADYHKVAEWNRTFLGWLRASLSVSRADIIASLSSPSGQYHAPVENVDTAGASWSFPQVMAWIATRDPMEVARMQYSEHFGPPMEDEPPGLKAMAQSDHGRRRLIGWLVLRTSLDHCTCGSTVTTKQEPWETCQCVGRAYDALRAFAEGTNHPIPEYQPKPNYGSFNLTWPDGAHELRFARAEVLERWPASALETAGEVTNRRSKGRKRGSGSMAALDAPLVSEMQQMIRVGTALSPHAASLAVAGRATGGGTVESKATRLAKRYRSSERN